MKIPYFTYRFLQSVKYVTFAIVSAKLFFRARIFRAYSARAFFIVYVL
jgi:hypothetical protein